MPASSSQGHLHHAALLFARAMRRLVSSAMRWLVSSAMRGRLERRRGRADGKVAPSTWYDAEQYRHPYVPPPRSRFPGEAPPASYRPSTYSALTDRWGRG